MAKFVAWTEGLQKDGALAGRRAAERSGAGQGRSSAWRHAVGGRSVHRGQGAGPRPLHRGGHGSRGCTRHRQELPDGGGRRCGRGARDGRLPGARSQPSSAASLRRTKSSSPAGSRPPIAPARRPTAPRSYGRSPSKAERTLAWSGRYSQLRIVRESAQLAQALGAAGKADGDGAIQADHRCRVGADQGVVVPHDGRPIGRLVRGGRGVAGRDSRLEVVLGSARHRAPTRRGAGARARCAARSHRERSCSARVSKCPSPVVRARRREAWRSISARSACTSGRSVRGC